MLHPIWQRVGCHPFAVPARGSAGAAGFDLAWSGDDELVSYRGDSVVVHPNCMAMLATGWRVQIPKGYVGLIRDRSGMAMRGLTTRAGVIDSDYRGEIKVLLRNESQSWVDIQPGQRIAQIVFVPCLMSDSHQSSDLDTTARGAGGFGSTGA